jgi:hypothetical protein
MSSICHTRYLYFIRFLQQTATVTFERIKHLKNETDFAQCVKKIKNEFDTKILQDGGTMFFLKRQELVMQ